MIDTAEKRRAAAGVPYLPLTPGVTPDATPGIEWRQQAAWSYSGAAGPPPPPPSGVTTFMALTGAGG